MPSGWTAGTEVRPPGRATQRPATSRMGADRSRYRGPLDQEQVDQDGQLVELLVSSITSSVMSALKDQGAAQYGPVTRAMARRRASTSGGDERGDGERSARPTGLNQLYAGACGWSMSTPPSAGTAAPPGMAAWPCTSGARAPRAWGNDDGQRVEAGARPSPSAGASSAPYVPYAPPSSTADRTQRYGQRQAGESTRASTSSRGAHDEAERARQRARDQFAGAQTIVRHVSAT